MNNSDSIGVMKTRFLPETETVYLVQEDKITQPGTQDLGKAIVLDAVNLMGRADFARTFQYTWRLISAPDGSQALISYSTFVRARLVPDRPGIYLVHLEASTARGTLAYVTRVSVDASGAMNADACCPVHRLSPAAAQSANTIAGAEEDGSGMKASVRPSDTANRPTRSRKRKSFLRRFVRALQPNLVDGTPYGDPVSTF